MLRGFFSGLQTLDDECNVFLQNVGSWLCSNAGSYFRRTESWRLLSSEMWCHVGW